MNRRRFIAGVLGWATVPVVALETTRRIFLPPRRPLPYDFFVSADPDWTVIATWRLQGQDYRLVSQEDWSQLRFAIESTGDFQLVKPRIIELDDAARTTVMFDPTNLTVTLD